MLIYLRRLSQSQIPLFRWQRPHWGTERTKHRERKVSTRRYWRRREVELPRRGFSCQSNVEVASTRATYHDSVSDSLRIKCFFLYSHVTFVVRVTIHIKEMSLSLFLANVRDFFYNNE